MSAVVANENLLRSRITTAASAKRRADKPLQVRPIPGWAASIGAP